MKSKLSDFMTSEKFVGDLPLTAPVAMALATEPRATKVRPRRESAAPKIVVCPPTEEEPEPLPAARGARLLRALGRRLARRAADADSLASSSGSDSDQPRADDRSSSSGSDSGSDGSERRRRHHSTVSLRRVFQSLSLASRSQSSSPTERARPPKKQSQPKRILRPPVTYTYVRGLSGLPTQRVPRHAVHSADAGMGLHR